MPSHPSHKRSYSHFAARNVLANSDYCPQCLSAGGPSTVSGGQTWPAGNHGLCGDAFSNPTPRNHEAGGKYWTGKVAGTYVEGQVVKFTTVLTAYHKGRLGFRICKINGGSAANETSQLTEACFDKNVLVQANVEGAQRPGDRYYHLGPSPPASGYTYETAYQLPSGLTCDGVNQRCVIQWYYLTGNSCTPPNEPTEYLGSSGNIGECGQGAPYPEEFWNCADVVIKSAGGSPTPSSPVPLPSPSPVASPSPSPVPSPSPSPIPVPSPSPVAKSPPPPKASPSPSPVPASPSPASSFCSTKGAYGFFADKASGCKSYYRCEATGSWFFSCPSGLLFSEPISACDWPANVQC